MRARFRLAILLLTALTALAAADVLAFDNSALDLHQQIAGYVAAGVPAADFTATDRAIAAARPYAIVSGSVLRDTLLVQRGQAKSRWDTWRLQQRRDAIEAALGTLAGGFSHGEPADIEVLSGQLDQALATAGQLKLDLDPGATGQDLVAGYWLQPRQLQLDLHDQVKQQIAAVVAAMQSRIAAKQQAQSLLGQAQTLLGEAQWLGTATAADSQDVSAAGSEVGSARTDAQLGRATQDVQKLLGTLAQEANSEPPQPLPTGPCLTGVPAQLIEVHLATQELIAYKDGCPWLATWITSGRPQLPTVRGTFHIFYKARWFLMQSPWPYWSPYWYPNTWVGYAMEIYNDGTFIHTADWEPPGSFGRDSQYGPYASHGCIHVQDGPAATLFAWAPIGTEVIVGD